jgi:hypothetical protein
MAILDGERCDKPPRGVGQNATKALTDRYGIVTVYSS